MSTQLQLQTPSAHSNRELPRRTDPVEEDLRLRRYVAYTLLGLFVFNSLCAISCVFLTGFGLMKLPSTLMHYFMAQTIGQGAAVVLLIARNLFSTQRPKSKPQLKS